MGSLFSHLNVWRPFGIFPKIHPIWLRDPSLRSLDHYNSPFLASASQRPRPPERWMWRSSRVTTATSVAEVPFQCLCSHFLLFTSSLSRSLSCPLQIASSNWIFPYFSFSSSLEIVVITGLYKYWPSHALSAEAVKSFFVFFTPCFEFSVQDFIPQHFLWRYSVSGM